MQTEQSATPVLNGAKTRLTVACVLLALCNLVLCLLFAERYFSNEQERREQAHQSVYQQAGEAVKKIDSALAPLADIAHELAAQIESRHHDEAEIFALLEKAFARQPGVFGIGLAYDHYQWSREQKLFAPFIKNAKQGLTKMQVNDLYDYTAADNVDGQGPRTIWYHYPMSKGAGWIPSYYGTASKTLLAQYAVPFHHPSDKNADGKRAGIAYVSYSLGTVDALVASLDLGEVGFAFLLDEDGQLLAYPMAKYLGARIAEIAPRNKFLDAITAGAKGGDERIVIDPGSGRSYFVHYKTIPATGWTLGTAFYEEALLNRGKVEYRLQIDMVLTFAAFVFFAGIVGFRVRWDRGVHLWLTAAAFSGLCLASIVAIWYLATSTSQHRAGIPLANNESVAVAVDHFDIGKGKLWHEQEQYGRWQIPTGIYIRSLKFSGPYEAKLTGYIWQRRGEGMPDDMELGFVLPEAEAVQKELVYDHDGTQGWDFEAELRQPFDYARYPFDHEDVWLRVWPKQLWKNAVLVPDLDGYSTTDPTRKPGLEKGIVVEGWRVMESFFSYRVHDYSVDFGFAPAASKPKRLELYFNIGIKREFYSAFVSQMIALMVVAFLLFAVLVTSTKKRSQLHLLGFNASSTLQYTSALFFVLIVSHIFLRDMTGAVGILYLEFFYFMMYLAILATSINAILFSASYEIKFIDYDDNFWVKLIYWPVLLFPMLLVSLYVFY